MEILNISVGFASVLLICSTITIFLWVIYIIYYDVNEKQIATFGGILMLMTILTCRAFSYAFSDTSITPIDVYRGKTTLEITYKDSIAIDSVVVWKY